MEVTFQFPLAAETGNNLGAVLNGDAGTAVLSPGFRSSGTAAVLAHLRVMSDDSSRRVDYELIVTPGGSVRVRSIQWVTPIFDKTDEPIPGTDC